LNKRFCLILVLLTSISTGYFCAADEFTTAGFVNSNGLKSKTDRQLRIYKESLLNSPNEESRVDAAVELLLRPDKDAREVLLGVMVSAENAIARRAVCKGLINSRGLGTAVRDRDDFLEPLIGMLIDEQGADAKTAAEALSVFKYREVAGRLRELVRSSDMDRFIRLNVIYALKVRPEKEAISELIKLLDDNDKEIAKAAEKALQDAFGIPAGTNRGVWKDILNELQRKSPGEIIRDRMVFQETEIRRLESERTHWRSLYLESLDREYEGLDDVKRGEVLIYRLDSEFIAVKLWSLDKISHRTAGMTFSVGPFRTKLPTLIAHPDRQVRLETAKMLTQMSEIDPAKILLNQVRLEQDREVRLWIFEALGEACYYAFSPGSKIKLEPEMRLETLKLAGEYLNNNGNEEAKKGAEVIRKLLESNGLRKSLVEDYLSMIRQRYERQRQQDILSETAGGLLNVMAKLCGHGSYRNEASRLFKESFLQGLSAKENDLIRESAVSGIVNIDRAAALNMFRQRGVIEDSSLTVKRTVIELAAELGSDEDIVWIVAGNTNGLGDSVWQAIGMILQREDAEIATMWAQKLMALEGVDSERIRPLLETAEKKAVAENGVTVLEEIRGLLLDVYLGSGDIEKTVELIAKSLAENDIRLKDICAVKINSYFDSQDIEPDAKAKLIAALGAIKVEDATGDMEKWKKLVKTWQLALGENGT